VYISAWMETIKQKNVYRPHSAPYGSESDHQDLPNTSWHQGIIPGTHNTTTMDTPMVDSQPKGVPSQNWRQNHTSTTLGDTTNLTQWLTHYARFPEGKLHSQRTCHPQQLPNVSPSYNNFQNIKPHRSPPPPRAIQNRQTSQTLAE